MRVALFRTRIRIPRPRNCLRSSANGAIWIRKLRITTEAELTHANDMSTYSVGVEISDRESRALQPEHCAPSGLLEAGEDFIDVPIDEKVYASIRARVPQHYDRSEVIASLIDEGSEARS